ncbi:MAG: response regulator transcription factor [Oscillospiraceae bacterium]|nr:response regulator transcription factor [Oscillospiraceae bacterium]
MKLKALTVEDNILLNKSIVNMLMKEGYEAFSALDIDEAVKVFEEQKPHIVLLDVMLPGGNGCDLIKHFSTKHDTRIIMLTAVDDDQSKRTAYESGVDDYITKPFDLYELVYKLSAIRKRIISSMKNLSVGDISFDVESNLLSCGERGFYIQPSQMRLLRCLFAKYEEKSFLDKAETCNYHVEGVDESQRLQTMIARLRKNLSDVGSKTVTIETIYNRGYELVVAGGKPNE